jgi:hypothetical protein
MNKHNQPAEWRESVPVPRHVAIIMDGNGRWAEQHGLPRSAGHRMGVEAVRRSVRAAMELGVQYLTIYSFSSENWARPASEIDDLMGLMRRFIRRDLAELHQNGVRIGVIGERDRVDPELLALIDDAVALTSGNSALNQLRLTGRDRPGGAAAGGASAGRRDQAAGHHARGAVGCARYARRARPRSAHPHQRRAAAVEFPPLAVGLYRVRVPRCLLARFRSRAAGAGDRRVP